MNRFGLNSSYTWALGAALVIAVWILSGELWSDDAESAQGRQSIADAQTKELMAVRAITSFAQPYVNKITIRGRTEALRTVTVKAETVGTVIAVPAEEGRRVSQGDVLCELSMNVREAQKVEAEANVQYRLLEHEAARQLLEKGHRSETQEAAALTAYDSALTALGQIELDIARTKIRAPFDGVLDNRDVEIGDYMRTGDACATLVDEQPFLIVGHVSETEVTQLSVGARGSAQLITGEVVEGKIRFISKRAQPATRTFRVELEVPNEEGRLRDGITAEIHVPLETVQAHKVSPAVLVLNDQGQIGLRTVDEDEVVHFISVKIVGDNAEGVWLSGLPDRMTIITVGHEYVSDGQKVTVHYEPAEGQS